MTLMKKATGSYRKQFRTARKADSETNRELKARLDNLAAKWLNECATAADVRDKVVMEQLIDTLPLAVKIFVKERHPENSEEAAKYARLLASKEGFEPGERQQKATSTDCHKV